MPFFVYEKVATGGHSRYHGRQDVKLAGNGLIQAACRDRLGSDEQGWVISAGDMLAAIDRSDKDSAIVIDTSPKRNSVNLFEVRNIVGFTHERWTPLMLVLEELFIDYEIDSSCSIGEFKADFTDQDCRRLIVKSILYLTGGYAGGNWNWGGNSRTTAALLWEKSWEFFRTYQHV